MLTGLSVLTICAGCTTIEERAAAAGARLANASLAVGAARKAQAVPALPDYCREHERFGVAVGDSPELVLAKGDFAIGNGNDRIDACAAWHDCIEQGRAGGPAACTKTEIEGKGG